MRKEYMEVWTHVGCPAVKVQVPRGTNRKIDARMKGADIHKEIIINF